MSMLLEKINNSKKNSVKLSDVAFVIPGFAFKSKDFNDDGIAVVKITEIQSPYVVLDRCSRVDISKYDSKKIQKYYLNEGEYVVAMTGATVGKVGKVITKEPLLLNQRVAVIRPKLGVSRQFIESKLTSQSFQAFINSIASGSSAQANISGDDIGDFVFDLPDLPIQNKIAEILSAYDARIENNNTLIKNLETTARTIFNEWFVKFRFRGYMKDEENLWPIKKLGELCDISIGRTPPREQRQWFSKNSSDIKWISIKDLGISGVYIFETDEFLTREAVQKFNIPIIQKNTLILSFKLTVGRVAITTDQMLSNEAIAHLKIGNNSNISTEYLYCLMKNYDYGSLASTSSIATAVNSKTIKNIEVQLPPRELMDSFTRVASTLFTKIHNAQVENLMLKNIKDQFLAKLI